ncbi:MAG: hypothetical protein KDH20_11260 [Rhodocyclaceae bacterium]|nr:hypothetical protein [Rhodocyclaceae bacterium]
MDITLRDWQIVCVEGHRGPQLRLAGRSEADAQYRISSMVVAYDPDAGEAETASGKRYTLRGERGGIERIERVIAAYRRRHGMVGVRMVSEEEAFNLFQLQATQISDYSSGQTMILG